MLSGGQSIFNVTNYILTRLFKVSAITVTLTITKHFTIKFLAVYIWTLIHTQITNQAHKFDCKRGTSQTIVGFRACNS